MKKCVWKDEVEETNVNPESSTDVPKKKSIKIQTNNFLISKLHFPGKTKNKPYCDKVWKKEVMERKVIRTGLTRPRQIDQLWSQNEG